MFAVCYGKFKAGKVLEKSEIWKVLAGFPAISYLLVA
jgi:hypothetical protein